MNDDIFCEQLVTEDIGEQYRSGVREALRATDQARAARLHGRRRRRRDLHEKPPWQ